MVKFCLNIHTASILKMMQRVCRDVACRKERLDMLSRKVVTRSGRGFRGYYPSKKLNRLVEFESLLERDAIKIFEHSDLVVSYQEQPKKVYYYDEIEEKKYFPDFQLVMINEDVIYVEVKPFYLLQSKIDKYKAIQAHYRKQKELFVILTDKEIRNENFHLKNLHKLYRKEFLSREQGDAHDAVLI